MSERVSRRCIVIVLLSVFCCTASTLAYGRPVSATTTKNPYSIEIYTSKPCLKVYRHGHIFRSFPIAVGKESTQSPIGHWRVISKQKNWGGGFGTRWIGLNVPWGIYGIHGTNRPDSIGKYASHGCIRMNNQDVERLYELIPLGTPVNIEGNPLRSLRMLESGDIGADVQWVQQRLQKAGFYRGPCNGKFSSSTSFGLTFFELHHHLPMDGVVNHWDYVALGGTQAKDNGGVIRTNSR